MTSCLPPLQYSLDELRLDTNCLFDLVLSDPEFEGLLPNLSRSAAVQAVEEAMQVLHTAPPPQVSMFDFAVYTLNIEKYVTDTHMHGILMHICTEWLRWLGTEIVAKPQSQASPIFCSSLCIQKQKSKKPYLPYIHHSST